MGGGYILSVTTLICNTVMNSIGYSIILIVVSLSLYLLTQKSMKRMEIKVLSYLGEKSYSLFLIHQNMGFCIIYFLSSKFGYNYIFSGLAEILMIVVGICLYYLVETNSIIYKHFQRH